METNIIERKKLANIVITSKVIKDKTFLFFFFFVNTVKFRFNSRGITHQ